ncbi:C1 family peptidase [Microvirga sp. M2]
MVSTPPSIRVGNREFSGSKQKLGPHVLDILPDMPDIRDRIYLPHLRALLPGIYPRIAFPVRNQGRDSSCTGFALAHVIDFLRSREVGPDRPEPVSSRMLYEMAKRNDEWEGSAYEGSSIRGALKGFYQNGVCSDATAPDKPGIKRWALTYDMAKEARETRLGAYFRVQPDISDYHAALNDIGVIYASAQIHSHWDTPKDGLIEPGGDPAGGHAFAIVGYDETGFWVLNSWGAEWGVNGIAKWTYADWANTIMDAWVLQLGVRAPAAFGAAPGVTPSSATGLFGFNEPTRSDIIGHYTNIDDGTLVTSGKYGSPTDAEMQETVERLIDPASNGHQGFDHLVIYAHGGLNTLAAEAQRIAIWKRNDIYGRNRIYNFHLMWGSGFIDEVFGQLSQSPAVGCAGGRISDWFFEAGIGRQTGSYAWRNMKQDSLMSFSGTPEYDGGFKGLSPLLSGLDGAARRPRLHLVGHSAGAIVLGYLLSALERFRLKRLELGSVHLMAPACTTEFFKEHYEPYLAGKGGLRLQDRIYLYNLTDRLEQDDTVSANFPLLPSYGHSLLYLVSRAYEQAPNTPLAGMQIYARGLGSHAKLDIAYSTGNGGKTASRSHGGFDNDAATLGTIMSRVLGKAAPYPPKADELTGY